MKFIAVASLAWLSLLSFLPPASAQPVVGTFAATGVTGGSATLNGVVNPSGRDSLGYFQFGPTAAYGYSGGFTVFPAVGGVQDFAGFVANGLSGAAGATWAEADGGQFK